MTSVQPRRNNSSSSSGNSGSVFIIAAAEGSEVNRRKERVSVCVCVCERERGRKDLRTPTKHGYPNDSIMHWIHSVAANQRNYQSPPWPGKVFLFFFKDGEKTSIHDHPDCWCVFFFFCTACSQSSHVCIFFYVSRRLLAMRSASIAGIHCGLIENGRSQKKKKKKKERKKISVGVSLSPASPPARLQLMSFVSPLDAQGA